MNRVLAGTLAVAGLVILMAQHEPNWHAIGIGVGSVIAFGILWGLPVRSRAVKTLPAPARVEVVLHEIDGGEKPEASGPRLLLDPPRYLELLEPGPPRTG